MRPLVSVIIPYYNAARFIGEALKSVGAQNYAPVEIIVVDDGSTEVLPPALEAADIKLIRQSNQGPSAARNTGLKAAKGKLIAFLDADDLWPEGKLALQTARLAADPDLQVVSGRIRYVWEDGVVDPPVGLDDDGTMFHAHLGALVARRSVFNTVGAFDEKLRLSEDHDWWLRVREQGVKVTVLNEPTLIYRRHQGNMTRGITIENIGLMEALKRSLDRRRKNGAARPLSAISAFNERLPLVSTLLPVYNGAAFLRETLESVLAQSYRAQEIIAIDDGSTDESPAILAEYAHRIRIIRQPNKGVAAARNTGLAHAKGAYIALIDQDDLWPPNKLEMQVAYLEAHPETGYVLGQQKMFLSPGSTRPNWLRPDLLEDEHTSYILGAMLARRSAFDIVGAFDEGFTVGDDSAWFFKAKDLNVLMHVLPERVLDKRVHGDNNSAKTAVVERDLLAVVRQSIKRQQKKSA